ncbi:hypothetical protein HMPREF9946_04045 [Acetobacteraceae bacterium AT-5844]|nr:hypothetical protein HMPREF9946_04045 [Acetobacteraceae bacterium AT-5844]
MRKAGDGRQGRVTWASIGLMLSDEVSLTRQRLGTERKAP